MQACASMEAAMKAAPVRRKYLVQKKNRKAAKAADAALPSTAQEVRPDGSSFPGGEVPATATVQQQQQPGKIGQKKRKKRMDTREVLKQMEAEGVEPQRMKMTDLIWRAEAMERLKAKDDPAKKAPAARRGLQQVREPEPEETPMAPQVQIVDGKIVINEQSLVISSRGPARTEADFTRVEESVQKLNYHSYSNRTPWERWKPDDTDKFYKALEQFGTDFGIIQQLFPGRTRRQVKAKYKNEEKANPRRLADALNHRGRGRVYHEDLVEMLRPPPAVDEVEELVHGDDFSLNQDEELTVAAQKQDELEADGGTGEMLVKQDEIEAGKFEVDGGPGLDFIPKEGENDMHDAAGTVGFDSLIADPDLEESKDTEQVSEIVHQSAPRMALFSYQMMS